MKLAGIDISSIQLPARVKKATYTSVISRGVTLVVQASRKIWIWRYTRLDGRRNSITLGDWPAMDEEGAAEAANAHRILLKRGIDPVDNQEAAKRQVRAQQFALGQSIDAKWRFATLAGEFLDHCEKTIRASSAGKYRQSFNAHLLPVLGGTDIRYLDVPGYQEIILGIASKSKSAAAGAHAAARAAMSYAVDRNLLPFNPLLGKNSMVKRLRVEPRKTFLSSPDLHRFLNEIDTLPDGALSRDAKVALRCQLMTGLRIGEILAMRWELIDFRKRIITHPADVMKGNVEAETVMPDSLRRLLLEWKRDSAPKVEAGRVFREGLDTQNIVDELRYLAWIQFTTHDLRRTARTYLQQLGCPEEIRKLITNHAKPTGMGRHYDHAKLHADQLHWLTVWSAALDRAKADPNALRADIEVADDDELLAEFGDVL